MKKKFYNHFSMQIMRGFILGLMLLTGLNVFGQTTVFFDNFGRTDLSPGGMPSTNYAAGSTNVGTVTMVSGAAMNSVFINSGSQIGRTYFTGDLASYATPFNTTLTNNTSLITWTFTLRSNRTTALNTFTTGTAAAVVLVADGANLASGTNGYAVTLTFASSTINKVELAAFTGGLSSVEAVVPFITSASPVASGTPGYVTQGTGLGNFGVRVTLDPTTDTWTLAVRDDGATSADPITIDAANQVGSPTVNSTYTGVPMSKFGALYFHTASAGNTIRFDNLRVAMSENLPVELTSFDAKRNQSNTLLSWATASEKDNAYFDVEYSRNGSDFQAIGQVKGNGTSIVSNTYKFEHKTPSVGVNYYRLKQVDYDGTSNYSPVRSVIMGKSGLALQSTLVHDVLNVVTSDETSTPLSIFNTTGQEAFTAKVQGTQQLTISTLPNGLYIVRTPSGDVARFVKQ
jgi:hypothetical protein